MGLIVYFVADNSSTANLCIMEILHPSATGRDLCGICYFKSRIQKPADPDIPIISNSGDYRYTFPTGRTSISRPTGKCHRMPDLLLLVYPI